MDRKIGNLAMTIYERLVLRFGRGPANATIIATRAALIVLIVMLSDKGFTSFTYLQLNR
jgi:hypothetical protein